MARDSYDESKNKKKKKTGGSGSQSSSSNNKASSGSAGKAKGTFVGSTGSYGKSSSTSRSSGSRSGSTSRSSGSSSSGSSRAGNARGTFVGSTNNYNNRTNTASGTQQTPQKSAYQKLEEDRQKRMEESKKRMASSVSTTAKAPSYAEQKSKTNKLIEQQTKQAKSNVQKSAPTAQKMMEQREQEKQAAKNNKQEWNTVKNQSKDKQREWFNQKMAEASERRGTGYESFKEKNQDTAAGRIISNASERWGTRQKRILTEAGVALSDIGYMANKGEETKGGRLSQDMAGLLPDRKKSREAYKQGYRDYVNKRNQRESELEKYTANAKGFEKTYYGAEDSLQGMLSDYIMGAALGGMWEIPLALRTYGGQRGKAKEQGATTTEDRLNAAKDSIIEVATEKIGGFMGAARLTPGRKIVRGLSDRIAGKVAQRFSGVAGRDFLSGAGRLMRNALEENVEEWIANPAENFGENVIWRNRVQAQREAENDAYFNDVATSIQQYFNENPDNVDLYIADINSKETRDELMKEFVEGGMTEKQADKVADKMIDFMVAAARNDTETMKAIKDSLDEDLVGDIRKKVWDWNENLESFASTTLLMMATGLPGTISTTMQGKAIKDTEGSREAMINALNKVVAFDPEHSAKAQSLLDSMENSYEPTATQAYDIMQDENRVMAEGLKNQAASDSVKAKGTARENLLAPVAVTYPDGSYEIVGNVTAEEYAADYFETLDYIDTVNSYRYQGQIMDDSEAKAVATTVASYKAGTLTVAEISNLTEAHPEARAVFQQMTGVDLNSYNVTDKNGNLNAAESNINMQKGLLAESAQNYIQSARAEQEAWSEGARVEAVTRMSKGFGSSGDTAAAIALEDVDPRDKGKFMLTAAAVSRVYDYARNTTDSWNEVNKKFGPMFKGVDKDAMRSAYEAAKEDKAKAETDGYGKIVRIGEKNSLKNETPAYVPGKVEIKTENKPTNKDYATLSDIADKFGLNIVLTDELDANENGRYEPKTRTIMLNSQNTMDDNLNAIFSHEVTHHLAAFAPEEYLKLSRLVMDRWYKNDEAGYKKAIAHVQALYKKVKDQDLTPEQALEEIIADNAHYIWTDEKFAEDICREEPTLAQAIINAIKDVLTKLRAVLSSGNVTDEQTQQSIFDQIGIYDDAYKLYLNAFSQAEQARADQAVDDWQDEVNAESESRHSISDAEATAQEESKEKNFDRGVFIMDGKEYPLSQEFKNAVNTLLNGGVLGVDFTAEDYNNLPEVKLARQKETKLEEKIKHKYGIEKANTLLIDTSERESQREEWTDKLDKEFGSAVDVDGKTEYNGDVIKGRRLDIIIGLSSSGKSSALVDPISHKYKSKLIDSDEAKKLIQPEYMDGWGANLVHQESKRILSKVYARALNRGDNIVLPIVGGSAIDKITEYINSARENGYNVYLRFNDLPPSISAARNLIRFVNDGRFVDLVATSFKYGNKPAENFDAIIKEGGLVDGYTEVSNNVERGENPRFIRGNQDLDFEWRRSGRNRGESVLAGIQGRDDETKSAGAKAPEVRPTDSEGNAITEQEAEVLRDVGPDVRFSVTTENEPQAKASFRAGKGEYRGFKNEKSGRELRTELINKNFSETQAKKIIKAIDSFMDVAGAFLTDKNGLRMQYQFIGWDDLESGTVSVRRDKNGKIRSVNFSAMKKNDEYPVNFDFSTVCNKRISFTKVIEEIAKAQDAETEASVFSEIKLTPDNMWKINEALKAEGIDTACLGCFVESRRYHIDTFFQNVEDRWNKPVREARKKLGLPEEEYFNFSKDEVSGEQWSAADDNWGDYGRSKAFKGAPLARTQALMDEIVKAGDVDSPLLKLIKPSDLLTPEGFEGFRKLSNAKIDMVGQIKSMYGAGVPKEILGFTPYNSEIALLPKTYKKQDMTKYLKSIGGIRIQSFSDFMIEHVFDHFQLIADAAYRGFPIHAYTKVIAYARIFGLTGAKINMSVMFDVMNSKQWADVLGISEQAAVKYADKYQGLRFVTEVPEDYQKAYDNADADEKLKKKYDRYIADGLSEEEARRKTADWAVRPYRPITLEGKTGYLTYLVSDADYVNEEYQRMYDQYISEGMSPEEAERKANSNKPFEQSINYREAKALQDQDGYRENVGIIGVAFGDEHLRMMMDDENIRYIIPYHSSSLPVVVSNKTNLKVARDYSDVQNTFKAKSWNIRGENVKDLKAAYEAFKKAHSKEKYPAQAFFADALNNNHLNTEYGDRVEGSNTGAFDVYEYLDKASNIRDVSEAYLEDCIENNYIPVFGEFAGHPGYYKMLFDFMVADDEGKLYPQHAVRNNYPGIDVDAKANAGETVSDADLTDLKNVIEEGAKAQNDKLQRWEDRKENVMNDLLSREGEHSIVADSNINSIRYGTEDYTDPKDGTGISPDSKFSISPEMDAEYMSAVNSGNMEEAQRLVDEAAKSAGYDTRAYHGTPTYGFTEFQDMPSAHGKLFGDGFYFTDSEKAAERFKVGITTGEGGVYNVFLKPGDDAFEFDWNNITYDGRKVKGATSKRHFIEYDIEKEPNRDVIVHNINDGSEHTSTVYVIKDAGRIKSADPVTYAEDGSVIPLSERFDPTNNDIRYSLPTQDSDDNILSDGQMEYFKNSQARDEQGRLVPVYHTTNEGGFTIFDPWRSDDHRSLFFTSNFYVSQTYGNFADKPFNLENPRFNSWTEFEEAAQEQFADAPGWDADKTVIENIEPQVRSIEQILALINNEKQTETLTFDVWLASPDRIASNYNVTVKIPGANGFWKEVSATSPSQLLSRLSKEMGRSDETSGYYEVYLNLENPLIIDGKGQDWSAISRGESKLPTNANIQIYSGGYLLEKADRDDDLFAHGQAHRDGSKAREEGSRANDNDEVVLHFENGERIFAKDDPDAVARAINAHYNLEEEDKAGETLAYNLLDGMNELWPNGKVAGTSWLNSTLITNMTSEAYNTRGWAEIAYNEGYDGVIIRNITDIGGFSEFEGDNIYSDIYIAFSSNQVKDTNNLNPTENPDIRYSIPTAKEVQDYIAQTAEDINDIPVKDVVLEENRVRYSISVDEFRQRYVGEWDEKERTFGLRLDEKSVKKHIIAMMKYVMAESETGKQYKTEVLEDTLNYAKVIWYEMKAYKTEAFADTAWKAAENIVDSIDYNDDLYVQYKGMRDYLSRRKIQIPEGLEYDSSFVEFVRDNDGRMRFDYKGSSVNAVYKYLSKKYPELIPADLEDPIDMLLQIDYALDYTTPYRDAYTSEEYTDLVDRVATTLIDIVSEGEAYVSVADKLTAEFDARTKAMKERHDEAIRKVRAERQTVIDNQKYRADMWKQRYYDRIQKDKQERAEKKGIEEHRKRFNHVLDEYNKLCKWVLEPTKDKNVPEEFRKALADFLQTMDLQTENSKKLEEKTGRVSQKTFKLRELKDKLIDLSTRKEANGTSLFDIDNSISFILQKLADKIEENGNNIDALDAADIHTIEVFMKLLTRNIERYKQVRTETKMAELTQAGGDVVEFMVNKTKRDGEYAKREGPPGMIQTINATSLTPAYLFERMGPLYEMYKVLRYNGFDAYIRNEDMIMNRLKEILGQYYKKTKKGEVKPGSILEDWRNDKGAQTIELENGQTITMSIAQMMSLRCLAKRGEQALGHMYVGGIVVTPIQTGSKMVAAQEKLGIKKKKESTQKYILTENDIYNITTRLTEKQARIADQLQELMSVDMARLGNEAHRELYGYEMFDEDNYFPIKVYGNERPTDVNNIGEVVEKIKSFGFTKPLTPRAGQAIEVGDIFEIVADHCNGMNLYNAYLVPITDFMKVFNYTHEFEDGTTLTVKEAIEQAYGKDMLRYILNLIKDINGIKGENRGGIEGIMNKALGRAKKVAVFGNIRVALQQPTAIVRAAAEINPIYLKGAAHLDSAKGFIPTVTTAAMEEMYKYCPISRWKSWGYYDTYMGRDIEDVMMNNMSIGDKFLAGYYGQLDNATWSIIWQAVKAEQADAHPEMDTKSEEFLKLCGRRASEVFDKTQVVDSTFHRSDAMRSRQVAVKLFTAFMSEPTLTLNVFRAGMYNAAEEAREGNKAKASAIRARTISVIVAQAIIVAAAQAFADAWRGKDPVLPWDDDDDDDEEKATYWTRWLHNFVYNTFDQLHLEQNMYLVKDVTPYINYIASKGFDYLENKNDWDNPYLATFRAFMGWDQDYLYNQNNLIFAAFENTANGMAQAFKKLEKGEEYDKDWYDINQKVASGLGTMLGFPAGTLMRDFKPIWEKLIQVTYADDGSVMEKVTKKDSDGSSKKGEKSKDKSSQKESTEEETEVSDSEALKKLEEKARKKAAGLSGDELDEALWDVLGEGYTKKLDEADMDYIEHLELIYMNCGGDISKFDARIKDRIDSAYKKTLKDDMTTEDLDNQYTMRLYMQKYGYSDEEISDIVYHTYARSDLQAAMRMGNQQFIEEEATKLMLAGMSEADFEKAYKNRNRGRKTYKGKYTDEKYLKSTGTYIWPASGPITSEFGYRNAPTAGASSNHPAIDIGAAYGSPVVAADGGTVVSVGWNGGYGNQVAVASDDGKTVLYYSHLSDWNVNVGDRVSQGAQIAQVGSTGNSTGPHLDFKVEVNGEPVNPMDYLSSDNTQYALDA